MHLSNQNNNQVTNIHYMILRETVKENSHINRSIKTSLL